MTHPYRTPAPVTHPQTFKDETPPIFTRPEWTRIAAHAINNCETFQRYFAAREKVKP